MHFCARCSILSYTRSKFGEFHKIIFMIKYYVVLTNETKSMCPEVDSAYCHTCDATQECQFCELTPPSCMTICCSVHKSALTYKEFIFNTFSNQEVLCICICLISCTQSETYAHVGLRDGGPVFRAPFCTRDSFKPVWQLANL